MLPDRTFEGFLLACDLDGTLLDPNSAFPPENAEALRVFLAGGGHFAVATGRTAFSVERSLSDIPSDLPGIFCNGAHLYDRTTRRTVLSNALPESARALVIDLLARFESVGLEVFTEVGAFLVRASSILQPQIEAEGLTDPEATLDAIPGPWLKLLIGGEPEELVRIRAHLEATVSEELSIVSSDVHLLDLMARGVSKGTALQELKERVEATYGPCRVLAVGDNENDLEMLRFADVGFAPGNAGSVVRSAADHVLPNHSEPVLPNVLRILRESYVDNSKNNRLHD
jgi:Cof subfamily protein (haloacid dehalogenase superfamily)